MVRPATTSIDAGHQEHRQRLAHDALHDRQLGSQRPTSDATTATSAGDHRDR